MTFLAQDAAVDSQILQTDNISVAFISPEIFEEFEDLPHALRDTAAQMIRDLSRTIGLGGLSVQEVAAVVAAPSFRTVLEREAQLNSLDLARRG